MVDVLFTPGWFARGACPVRPRGPSALQDLSAAAVLETLYFYALAHQNDFDVCWPRGSIAELIFQPLVERIRAAGGGL